MPVPEVFQLVEATSFSKWIRSSQPISVTDLIAYFHIVGFAVALGASAMINLRSLGGLPGVALKPLRSIFPMIWGGFAISLLTGLLLLIGYPTKELTNPAFYVKLLFVALALLFMRRIQTQVFDVRLADDCLPSKGKALAIWSLLFWFVVLSSGKLLAYTYSYLTYGRSAA